MMKKLLLLFLLLPIMSIAQSGTKTYNFDLKKKHKQQDSIPPQDDDDEDSKAEYKKEKKEQAEKRKAQHKPDTYDFKKDGIFRGLFSAGINACQIDGDAQWGYTYVGAEAGIGAMARFHRFFSVSLELEYTMKGARARFPQTDKYNVQWDYVSAPIAVNGHFFKDRITISAGFAPGLMVRYEEFNSDAMNVTGHSGYGQPHIFDLDAFAGIQYTFLKHYALGFQYSYSTISIRPAVPERANGWINGQYNNVLTFRFVYILGPFKKK